MAHTSLIYCLILGMVQGITEWLPISSSGHLVIVQHVFHAQERTLFDAVLHLGTLVAAVIYFREDIKKIAKAAISPTKADVCSDSPYEKSYFYAIVVASLPIVVSGYFLSDAVERCFFAVNLVGIFFIVNGIILMLNVVLSGSGKIKISHAAIIGLAQTIALLPGISRSGVTVTTARSLRIGKKNAARFSIMISVLPITAAAIYKLWTASSQFHMFYLGGFFASFITGYGAIKLFLRAVTSGKIHYFGIYTIVLGVILLII